MDWIKSKKPIATKFLKNLIIRLSRISKIAEITSRADQIMMKIVRSVLTQVKNSRDTEFSINQFLMRCLSMLQEQKGAYRVQRKNFE